MDRQQLLQAANLFYENDQLWSLFGFRIWDDYNQAELSRLYAKMFYEEEFAGVTGTGKAAWNDFLNDYVCDAITPNEYFECWMLERGAFFGVD